jgi:hypothetical protein
LCWLTLLYSVREKEAAKQSGTSVGAQGIFCVGKYAILIIVAAGGEVIEGCVENLCIMVVTQSNSSCTDNDTAIATRILTLMNTT